MHLRPALAALLATAAAGLAAAPAAHADVVWLCHPSLAAATDPCETPLDTTVVAGNAGDGARTVVTPPRPTPSRRAVDCFYVYPTVSNQLALNASKARDPEIVAVAKFQASRFSVGCRMFAPIYREVTVAGVVGNGIPAIAETAYGDVAEAFKQYLAQDNGGRGVILIGHSQGSLMLRALIRRVIDADPQARARLVGAFLLGGNVTTKAGSPTDGDFAHVPVCTRRGEDGCVVAYSTYSTDPLPVSFFGNTNTDPIGGGFGFRSGSGYEVACTDPGTLSGVTGAVPFLVPTQKYPPGFISGGIDVTANGPIPSAPTTWVEGFAYRGACRTINGAHVYRYAPEPGARMLNEFPPAWGTHLVDFNLGVERLLSIAAQQSTTWLDAHLAPGTVRVNRSAGTATVPVDVPGAGTVTLSGTHVVRRTTTLTRPGTRRLRVTPTRRAARSLRRHGRLTTRVRIAYRPAGGETLTRTVRVVLRRR